MAHSCSTIHKDILEEGLVCLKVKTPYDNYVVHQHKLLLSPQVEKINQILMHSDKGCMLKNGVIE